MILGLFLLVKHHGEYVVGELRELKYHSHEFLLSLVT